MTDTSPLIAVYIVTFRRPHMLRRAIASVLAQTHQKFKVSVINDDPSDDAVEEIVSEFGDSRISLFTPIARRGGTRNFNIAFAEKEADFVSLLEDDNWWEPEFLARQLKVLDDHPKAFLVVGNERLHREQADGSWLSTGQAIWPFNDVVEYEYRVEDLCGPSRVCNSSMLVRVAVAGDLQTPDTIDMDVSELFRERFCQPRILLNGEALTNYAVTLDTGRSTAGDSWGLWQCVLFGSLFVAVKDRRRCTMLARRLWGRCDSQTSPLAVTLMMTGAAVREARPILRTASIASIVRFAIWIARRPIRIWRLATVRRRHARELAFLVNAPLTRHLAKAF